MEFISRLIERFCFNLAGEDQPSDQHQKPELAPLVHGFSRNNNLFTSGLLNSLPDLNPSSERLVFSRYENPVTTEELHSQNDLEIQQSQDNPDDLRPSDSFQQEVSLSSDSFLSHNYSSSQDSDELYLSEELHLQELEDDDEDVWNSTSRSQLRKAKREKKFVKGDVEEEKWLNDYSSFQKILLVGECDFSFSAALGLAFISASNMIATSLYSRGYVKSNYGKSITNIADLKRRGCKIIYGVNAINMENHPSLKNMKFDRIVYHFPHSGFSNKESHDSQVRRHQNLVSKFLENTKSMISEDGEIHITHKTSYAVLREWNMENLGTSQGLKFIRVVDFDLVNNQYKGKRNVLKKEIVILK